MTTKKKKWKEYLALLMVLTLIFTGLPNVSKIRSVHAANDDDMTVTVNDFKINDQPAEADMKVKDGDSISFELNWVLKNMQREQKEFEIDLTGYLKNITLSDASGDIPSQSGDKMGTYTIKDNVLTIILEDEYVSSQGERSGGFNIRGTIKTGLSDDDFGEHVEVGFDNTTFDVIYSPDVQEGNANVNKTAGTVQKNADGKYQAPFTITINTWGGKVRKPQLTEVPGNGLSNPSNIKVKKPDGTEVTCADFDEVNRILAEMELQNQTVTITYTMEVDEGIATAGNNPGAKYTNNVTLDYDKLKDTPVDEADRPKASATVKYAEPYVTKGGYLTDDNQYVEWLIDIYLNSFYASGKSLSDYVQSVLDTVGDGLILANGNLTLGDAEDKGNGHYQFKVKTKITDEYLNSAAKKELTNHVDVTLTDGKTIGANGVAYTTGRKWIKKDFESYDSDTKKITWKITLDNIPSDLTKLTLMDTPDMWNGNDHVLDNTNISIGVKGTSKTPVVLNGMMVPNNIISSYSNSSGELTFNTTWLSSVATKEVEIFITTTVQDKDLRNKKYVNGASLSWTEGGKSDTCADNATWELPNAVSKTGNVVDGKNSISYCVGVNIKDIDGGNVDVGKKITIKDKLPEKLKVNADEVSVSLKSDTNPWSQKFMDLTSGAGTKITVDGDELTVEVTISEALKDKIEEIIGWNNTPYIVCEYTASVKDEKEFIEKNQQETFRNEAEAEYDGDNIGSNYDTQTLTPQKVVAKEAKYDESTAPYIYYTITVNPSGADLSADKLTAVDSLGSLLSYDFGSITVEKTDGTKLVAQEDYNYIYDEDSNSITFELPDATPLKISYRARINAPYDRDNPANNVELTTENSYNKFSLSGIQGDNGKDQKSFNRAMIKPNAWGSSTSGSVTLKKYWTDGGQMTALPGAKFEIYETVYNAATDTLQKKDATPIYADIVIGQDGTYKVTGLLFDHIYALYETEAPEGFVKNEKPYYFVIQGSDFNHIKIPAGVNVKVFDPSAAANLNENQLLYENKMVENAGKLILTKTIIGPGTDTEKQAQGALKFKVTNTATGVSSVYTLLDFTYDTATGKYTMTLPRTAGTYTVEETETDINGYMTKSVKYSVNDGSQVSGKSTNVTIAEDETTTVAFEDVYETIKTSSNANGKLQITKTIKGPVTKGEAKDSLEFTISDSAETTTDTYTLEDFTYNGDTKKYTLTLEKPAGTYTVTETVTDIDGYETESVKYSINDGAKREGEEASVSVESGKTTKVAFQDTYTEEEETGSSNNTKVPKTGDSRGFMVVVCIHMAIISTAGLVIVNRRKKKKA